MRILEWIGKPVLVLLNQMGEPKPPEAEQADVNRWKDAMSAYPIVSSVLPMDAFARCWVQEFALFDAIAEALPEELQATFDALRGVWSRKRRAAFSASIQAMAHYIEKLANDREIVESGSIMDQIKFLGKRLGLFKKETVQDPISAAQTALASRAADEFCALTDKLIVTNSLTGKGVRKEILRRMQSEWEINRTVPLAPAAVVGAVGSGTVSGLATDFATGGLSMGLGTLVGTVVGALGGAGLAAAYNHQKGTNGNVVSWSDEGIKHFLVDAILLYLSIAHYGRGRGNWTESEQPTLWKDWVATSINKDIKSPQVAITETISSFFKKEYKIELL